MPRIDDEGPERIMGNREMTFLQYLCEQLLGPPLRQGGSYGESYWTCHFCGKEKFHTFPDRPEYPKQRWSCHVCGMRGDAADLLGHLYPGEYWPQRRLRLEHYQQDYEAEVKRGQATDTAAAPVSFSFSGETGIQAPRVDRRKVALAWANLTHDERQLLLSARGVMEEKAEGVDFNALTNYCSAAENWVKLLNDQHLEECQDPECDDYVCRAQRGLPPLTREAIAAEQDAKRERQRELQERAREGLRRRFKHHPANLNGTGGNHAADRNGRA